MSARDVIARKLTRHLSHGVTKGAYNKADAIISALRANGYVIERDWQPIETAPKEYRQKILALLPDGQMSVAWWDDDEYAVRRKPRWSTEKEFLFRKQWAIVNQPTHWRPLPTPPKEAPDAP